MQVFPGTSSFVSAHGWPALEDKMARGDCHPQVAYEYAVKVLRGPLPGAITNWLLLDSFDAEGVNYLQQYLAFAATKASQPPRGNAHSPLP